MSKYYWLNDESRAYLSRGYLSEGETAEERIWQIANKAEEILGIKGFAEKFEDYLSRGWYSLSSPIWSNFSKDRGLPISCFGSYIGDSMEDILEKAAEVGMMTKAGGGTSAYFGALRGRGSKISSGGESTGSVHFMEIFDKLMNVVSQGNVRRGSFAAYLPVDHPDILEFLRIRDTSHTIQEMSIGVCISDQWMNDLLEKKKDNMTVWKKILEKRASTGYPYIVFSDTANNNAPQVYKDKGLRINNSNLCVAGNTKLLTKEGEIVIGKNVGKEVEVWNGKEWSKTTIVKTGENQELINLKFSIFSDGIPVKAFVEELVTTPYHKFYLQSGEELRAGDLIGVKNQEMLSWVNDKNVKFKVVLDSAFKSGSRKDTYCVNEPLEHKVVFNGVLTGQCNEIMLANSESESFVCDLSSMNLLHYDDWKDTDAVETLICFLDAVMSEFISKTENMKFMDAPRKFAINQRALGLGVLGWHSYLQSKMIAFESMEAKLINAQIWKNIAEKCDKATKELAVLLGVPPLLEGYGIRNSTTRAIAPTTSSSFILGQVSPSIEPLNSNYFVKDLAKGKFTFKNPYLKKLLKEKGESKAEVWKSILTRGGSVQHLEFLSQEEKDVFKTFGEISQMEIVNQAATRQKYVDQGQSLNLMIPPNTVPKEISILLIEGWKKGLKGFYYQRSFSPVQELARSILHCSSCES